MFLNACVVRQTSGRRWPRTFPFLTQLTTVADLGRGRQPVDRSGNDTANNDHSTHGPVLYVLQHRRQTGVSTLRAAVLRARLPQLPDSAVRHVHKVCCIVQY